MKILLTGRFDPGERERWLQALQAALPEAQWRDEAEPEIEIAVVANPPPGSLQGLPRLRLIQSLWAGVDRVLADTTLPADVPLCRMVDPAMAAAMAETALWAVLSLHRGFFRYAQWQRESRWHVLPQRRADEVRVTVLGLGELGREAARRLARQGYAVTGWSRRPQPPFDGVQTAAGADALPALLARSDIVLNLLPLTPDTRGLLDARFFAALPRGAGLVNLARGAHGVDEDLLAALDAGQLGHAVLDVFNTEPLPTEHRYWQHPQVTMLPHAAALTDPRTAAEVVAANVRALLAGRPLAHRVERAQGY